MSAQVYVVEGADGTGKSTFIQRMARPGDRLIHNNASDHLLPGSLARHYRAQLLDALDFRDRGISTYIDRSFLSEVVYGRLYRGNPRVSLLQAHSLERFAARHGIVLLGMTADLSVRRDRIRERGEEWDRKQPFVGAFYSQHFGERARYWATADSTPAHES